MFGHLGTSDLLIPESNTFFSLHINPHFPTAMALMVGMMLNRGPRSKVSGRSRVGATMALSAMSLALAIVQPFAVVMVYATLGVHLLLRWRRDRQIAWLEMWTVFIAGVVTLPLLIYTFWVTQADPVLHGWMAQNVTPSPPVWDYALGYGLILVLAVPGAIAAIRRRSDTDLLFLAWIGVTAIALYAPFALQRRFSLGLHIPLAILAALGLCRLTKRRFAINLTLAATLLTTLLVMALAIGGGLKQDPRLFVSADEARAMDWLHENAPRNAVVLASPEMGLFIPAWAGRRVVYGHPFETVDAERTKARVENFFAMANRAEREAMLREWKVAFVFAGPRERALGLTEPPGRVVFRNAIVTIYAERE
jgi:asparagine N-glycosylation enzyme membrane subunit Stt3